MVKETDKKDFSWEENTHTFFGNTEETVVIDPTAVIEKAEKDELIPGASEDEEFEENYQFNFGETSEEEEEEEEDEEGEGTQNKDKKPVSVNSKSTLEFLKEKGLIDFQLEEGEELTDDLAEAKLEDFIDNSIEEGVAEMIKDLPDPLKNMIKFVNDGGDFSVLLAKMANNVTSSINKNTDITVEANQVLAVKEDLKAQGYDDEYIDTHIEVLKDSGKLEAISKKAFDKIVDSQSKEEQAEVERIAKAKEEAKKKQRAFKTELTSHIGSLKEVGGLSLAPQEQKELPSYISDATVELEDGRVTTGLQRDLFKIFGDKDKLVLLAKLVKTDFDFSSISKKEVTKFSKEIEKDLQNAKTLKGYQGSSRKPKKSLADLID